MMLSIPERRRGRQEASGAFQQVGERGGQDSAEGRRWPWLLPAFLGLTVTVLSSTSGIIPALIEDPNAEKVERQLEEWRGERRRRRD